MPEPYSPSRNPMALAIAKALEDFSDKYAGHMRRISTSFCFGRDCIDAEPSSRERLDHYGTSTDSEGNEQEGWDSEGWEYNYAGPLRDAVKAHLLKHNIDVSKISIDVDEKGYVDISI